MTQRFVAALLIAETYNSLVSLFAFRLRRELTRDLFAHNRCVCYFVIFPRFLRTQDKRITVVDALAHPYLDEGRLRYHSCMCTCCYTTSAGMRQYRVDFEPSAAHPFDDLWERKLTSVQQVKGKIRTSLPRIFFHMYVLWNNDLTTSGFKCRLFAVVFSHRRDDSCEFRFFFAIWIAK